MRPHLFGTLFYANYLTRALALYHSLEETFREDFTLVMLCMDNASEQILSELRLPRVRLLPIRTLEEADTELVGVKASRSIAEYAWTCTPSFLIYLIGCVRDGEAVAYLDADLMYFSDPQPIFDEWADNDILIHEHRYAPRNRHMEKDSGVFNVGLVGVRASAQGRRCLIRWRGQCLAACTLDPERGLCGDQKYLDEWPALYDRLTVIRHKGAGLAPWNLEQYQLSAGKEGPSVDGANVIFYHYHALRILWDMRLWRCAVIPSLGYEFTRDQLRLLYLPYVKALRHAFAEVHVLKTGSLLPRSRTSFQELKAYRRRVLIG